jgi:hypothetical protein
MRMRTRTKTTDRITPAGRRFYAQVGKLKGEPYVKVGVIQRKFKEPKEGGYAGRPITLGEVAVVNEFGSRDGRVPERSYIRSTHDEKNRDVTNYLKRKKLEVVAGQVSARKVLEEVGAQMQAHIYDKIIELRTPPNAPATIARKGSDNPLIAEGQLLRAVGWEYHGSD